MTRESETEEQVMSAYAHMRDSFGVHPRMRERVRSKDSGRTGEVIVPLPHLKHYVRVKFDGENIGTNCHPNSLEYGLAPKNIGNLKGFATSGVDK